jgi:hypothetical protein
VFLDIEEIRENEGAFKNRRLFPKFECFHQYSVDFPATFVSF